ncbi:MAG TPA: excinuclease ABC subunit UvrA [Candidatus Aminicenantes bacterium]|nr:excinuclease ABC subunit UvrA [Candidatus Aminicenantes bacterium]HRY64234.1 excinuclease ABC subunit UvrA [Candidatus Aminicenantes bacterium]HRZ71147.1 excinuclease ABC subunit UvrA [Candidatus Aminicenantes bacterium]
MATTDSIILRGVRVHNLKGIDLDVPLDRLIVVTGVSGSGKSSLAFDTLYAEGQRRYLESLSSYARQFLERLDKPDADLIDGIPPAIAIQQKGAAKNPRSTVATVTEIYDFLRVLFARIGTVHCLRCGRPVVRDTIDGIIAALAAEPAGTRALITFAWPRERSLAALKKEGFTRAVVQGQVVDLDAVPKAAAVVDVLVDRIALGVDERERLADSIEMGLKKGGGRVLVRTEAGREHRFTDKLECRDCGLAAEDPYPNLFSFNTPHGACPECHGFGDLAVIDEDKVVPDRSKSLEQGAVEPWTKPLSRGMQKELLAEARRRKIPTNVPFRDLKAKDQRFVFDGGDGYYGVKGFFDWLQSKKYKVQVRVLLSRYRKYVACPACGKTRLNPRALGVRVNGLNIGEIVRLTVAEASEFFGSLELRPYERQVAEKLVQEIRGRLRFLMEVGLDYIALDRMTFTLSGGEAQRISLAAALSASLVGSLFVLDEPSIGLHPRDNHRLVRILKSLRDIGNTVVVVEHDPDIVRAAEYVIDMGPRAGEAGGEVVFAGPWAAFLRSRESLTSRYIRGEKVVPLPPARRPAKAFLEIRDAHKHNLKHIDVRIPLGVFTCVTGVSGSGKSSLIEDVLYEGLAGGSGNGFAEIRGRDKIAKVLLVDQSPLSASPRSIPATYTKAMDGIRDLFSSTREAKLLGFRPGYFSFNTAGGRCEECKGAGVQVVEMQFLSDVSLVCDACKGRRFKKEILDVRWNGKNIDEVLGLSVTEACLFFAGRPEITRKLYPLVEVGLGYLKLGQSTTTLSGGELQRIKLAYHLVHEKGKKILYLFDEPTIGLHPNDVAVLLRSFQRLVAEGHTVIVIEHNLDVIKSADHVIDLGPEGGQAGGRIVAQGTPEKVAQTAGSVTAPYLLEALKSANGGRPVSARLRRRA